MSAKAPSALQTKFASFSLHQYAVGAPLNFATVSGLGVRTGAAFSFVDTATTSKLQDDYARQQEVVVTMHKPPC
jgi:hypothetical protein